MRIVRNCWDIRVTTSGSHIWSPRPISQPRESGSFQECLSTVSSGDVIFVFEGYKLKLVAVALGSQQTITDTGFFSEAGWGLNGCSIWVVPLYHALIKHGGDDPKPHENELTKEDLRARQDDEDFNETLSKIEQIRRAQASNCGFKLAHEEMSTGQKKNDWVRWVFPDVASAVNSPERNKYRLSDLNDAVQFLHDPELGANYVRAVDLAWNRIIADKIPSQILMGSDADSDALRSSLELFLNAWNSSDDKCTLHLSFPAFCTQARELIEVINPSL